MLDGGAQGDTGVAGPGKYIATYSAKDCFSKRSYRAGFRPDSLRPNQIMKGVRIWRSISMDNKQNEGILNSTGNCMEVGLFEIIKFGVFEKQLHLFSSDNFDDAAHTVLSRDGVLRLITINDSSAVPAFDANGEPVADVRTVKQYRMGADVKSYLIKEDWVTSSLNGKTEKYIIGIAPLVFDEKSGKTIPLFWLYYPEWKGLFAAFPAKNMYSHEPVTLEDVFRKRYFFSVVSKESNVFDRGLKTHKHGEDVFVESEAIKEKMNNNQTDLFQH